MSEKDFHRADRIITWGLRTVIGLGLSACALLFQDVRSSIAELATEVHADSKDTRDRLMRLETKMEDLADNDRDRDKAINELAKRVDRYHSK